MKSTDAAGLKGYDAGKKVSGIKRHIAVDMQDLPHAVAVSTAEVTDRKGALQALKRCKAGLKQVQIALCDRGYVSLPFAQGVRDTLGERITVQIAKRDRAAHLQSHAKALDCRAQLCLAGEEPAPVEELRALDQYPPAVHPSGISGFTAPTTLNTLLAAP